MTGSPREAKGAGAADDVSLGEEESAARTQLWSAHAFDTPVSGPASDLVPGPAVTPVPIGTRVGEQGRFEVLAHLGQGAMGVVYRARDHQLERDVALKFFSRELLDGSEGTPGLALHEARVTARQKHPNIVNLFDLGAWQGYPFIVMELLEGEPLSTIVQRGPLLLAQGFRFMLEVTSALEHAHANRFLHRDLKPSNVFVGKDGHCKVLDFGIARAAGPGGDHGEIAGTPLYMAPEVWLGIQDERTDLWSAAVMFFELLTGVVPFSIEDRLKPNRPVPSARSYRPGLPEMLDEFFGRALANDPSARFQNSRDFSEALELLSRRLRLGADVTRGDTERRQVTILVCVADSGPVDDLPDEAGAGPVGALLKHSLDLVTQHGGLVMSSLGDTTIACFGYPLADQHDAVRAVDVGVAIIEWCTTHPDLQIGIGVHTGFVVVEANPSAAAPPTFHGGVPRLAAALAQRARGGKLLLSESTWAVVKTAFESTHDGSVEWSGEPVSAVYRVHHRRDSPTRFDRHTSDRLGEMVGRRQELEAVRDIWHGACDANGAVLVLCGEAGIGKSRLVRELVALAEGSNDTSLTSQCWPQFTASALHPVIQLAARSVGIRDEHSNEEKLALITGKLEALGLDNASGPFGALTTLLSVQTGSPPSSRLSAEQRKQEALEGLVSLLLAFSARAPLLLTVEDVHWSDPSTLEFLQVLAPRVTGARILVVLTSRTLFRPAWSGVANFRSIELSRLPNEATLELIERLSGGDLERALRERLAARSNGIPLFVEQLTQVILETRSTDTAGSTRADIPVSLQELLRGRLDRLKPSARRVLQLGAVVGVRFSSQLLAAVGGLPVLDVEADLAALCRAGLLLEHGTGPETRFEFSHALLQEVAYQALVGEDRRRCHEAVAGSMSRLLPDHARTHPEVIAHHFKEAALLGEAVEWYARAGRLANEGYSVVEAISHYRSALELTRRLPATAERERTELRLELGIASPLMAVHGYAAPEVRDAYTHARDLAHLAGEDQQLFPSLHGLWQYTMVAGELGPARELADQQMAMADAIGEPAFRVMACRALATTHVLAGNVDKGRGYARRGLETYDFPKHRRLCLQLGHDPAVACHFYAAWANWLLMDVGEARRMTREGLDLARRLEHPLTLAFAHSFAATMRNADQDYAEALSLAEAAMAMCTAHRFALWLAWARMERGYAMARSGDSALGDQEQRSGYEHWRRTGANVATNFLVCRGTTLREAGAFEEAAHVFSLAEKQIETNAEYHYFGEYCRQMALITLDLDAGARERAQRFLIRGLESARRLGHLAWQTRLEQTASELEIPLDHEVR